MWEEKQRNRCQ